MTGETVRPSNDELFATIAGLLLDVTGTPADRGARIAPESAIEGDLGLESMELVELGERMRAEFGDRVDLAAYVAGLDIDELIELRVADLVDYVAGNR
ncbi:MAG TPA: phosphopantetheine-binding protein [Pseudonocardiaceae bacterium]|nr:phosphopantetheine-binding protein [Pseudonocardiaceae bacterium]